VGWVEVNVFVEDFDVIFEMVCWDLMIFECYGVLCCVYGGVIFVECFGFELGVEICSEWYVVEKECIVKVVFVYFFDEGIVFLDVGIIMLCLVE